MCCWSACCIAVGAERVQGEGGGLIGIDRGAMFLCERVRTGERDARIESMGLFPATAILQSPVQDEVQGPNRNLTMAIATRSHPITHGAPGEYAVSAYLNPSFAFESERDIDVLAWCRQTGNALMAARNYGEGGAIILAVRPEYLEQCDPESALASGTQKGAVEQPAQPEIPAGRRLMKKATRRLLSKNRFCGIKLVRIVAHFKGGLAREAPAGLMVYAAVRVLCSRSRSNRKRHSRKSPFAAEPRRDRNPTMFASIPRAG